MNVRFSLHLLLTDLFVTVFEPRDMHCFRDTHIFPPVMRFVWATNFLRNLLRLKYLIIPFTAWKFSMIYIQSFIISAPSNAGDLAHQSSLTNQWSRSSSGTSSRSQSRRFSEEAHTDPRQKWKGEEHRRQLPHLCPQGNEMRRVPPNHLGCYRYVWTLTSCLIAWVTSSAAWRQVWSVSWNFCETVTFPTRSQWARAYTPLGDLWIARVIQEADKTSGSLFYRWTNFLMDI